MATVNAHQSIPAIGTQITAISGTGELSTGIVFKTFVSMGVLITNPLTNEIAIIENGTEFAIVNN